MQLLYFGSKGLKCKKQNTNNTTFKITLQYYLSLLLSHFTVESRAPPFPRYAPDRRHEPQGGQYRPPPDRPYSAGAQPIYTVSPERHYEPTYRKSFESGGGYLSSPERRYEPARVFAAAAAAAAAAPVVSPYEEPYYGGAERIYGTRSGSVTPVVDEEAR